MSPGEPAAREVTIRGDTIRLGQLLKLSGMIGAGAEVKALLARAGAVQVNGEDEARRGRQLHPGDIVVCGDETLRIVGKPTGGVGRGGPGED